LANVVEGNLPHSKMRRESYHDGNESNSNWGRCRDGGRPVAVGPASWQEDGSGDTDGCRHLVPRRRGGPIGQTGSRRRRQHPARQAFAGNDLARQKGPHPQAALISAASYK